MIHGVLSIVITPTFVHPSIPMDQDEVTYGLAQTPVR